MTHCCEHKVKPLPCAEKQLAAIAEKYGTPFHIYCEDGIRDNVRRLQAAFAWNQGFREYFAVKANPNPYLLEILQEEGCGADCSSLAELVLADAVGYRREDILFSSNNTTREEYAEAYRLGAIINVDDISHLDELQRRGQLSELLCFRYNPGQRGIGNALIGEPHEAKYGMTELQLLQAVRWAHNAGVRRIGLHTMVVSNELNEDALVATAEMMFALAAKVKATCGITVDMIDLGGGIGIPYRPSETAVSYERYGERVRALYERDIVAQGLGRPAIVLECGRAVTGPYGWLVTRAIRHKDTYKHYIGVDASMADLMRPGMYGAYHHLSVLGATASPTRRYDVVGSLCENNDKFAIDRELPKIHEGDILVIHDTGAHGYAMGFNYNGKLKSQELLLQSDGTVRRIRRAETLSDYFATLDYPGLP